MLRFELRYTLKYVKYFAYADFSFYDSKLRRSVNITDKTGVNYLDVRLCNFVQFSRYYLRKFSSFDTKYFCIDIHTHLFYV